MKATATYSPTKWDEKPYLQNAGMKLAKAAVEYAFHGQMEGQCFVDYLMFYSSYDEHDPHKAKAFFVGLTRFKGVLNGKAGDFVMEERGTFEGGIASATLTILPGSGTDDLKGITGTGKTRATQNTCECELDYQIK